MIFEETITDPNIIQLAYFFKKIYSQILPNGENLFVLFKFIYSSS